MDAMGVLAVVLVLVAITWGVCDTARELRLLRGELVKRSRNLHLGADDVLLLTHKGAITLNDEQYQRLRATMEQFLGGNKCLIIDDTLDIEVLRRDPQPDANANQRYEKSPENAPLA